MPAQQPLTFSAAAAAIFANSGLLNSAAVKPQLPPLLLTRPFLDPLLRTDAALMDTRRPTFLLVLPPSETSALRLPAAALAAPFPRCQGGQVSAGASCCCCWPAACSCSCVQCGVCCSGSCSQNQFALQGGAQKPVHGRSTKKTTYRPHHARCCECAGIGQTSSRIEAQHKLWLVMQANLTDIGLTTTGGCSCVLGGTGDQWGLPASRLLGEPGRALGLQGCCRLLWWLAAMRAQGLAAHGPAAAAARDEGERAAPCAP